MAETEKVQHATLQEAILAVMADAGYVQKEKPKEGGIRYSIKSESAVLQALRPALIKHGIIMLPAAVDEITHSEFTTINREGKETTWNRVVARFTYALMGWGESLYVIALGEGADTGDKAVYKAMTGSKKNVLLNAFLMVTGDDPDEDESPSEDERSKAPSRPYSADVLVKGLRKAAAELKGHTMAEAIRQRIFDDLNGFLAPSELRAVAKWAFELPDEEPMDALTDAQVHTLHQWASKPEFAKAEAKALIAK